MGNYIECVKRYEGQEAIGVLSSVLQGLRISIQPEQLMYNREASRWHFVRLCKEESASDYFSKVVDRVNGDIDKFTGSDLELIELDILRSWFYTELLTRNISQVYADPRTLITLMYDPNEMENQHRVDLWVKYK